MSFKKISIIFLIIFILSINAVSADDSFTHLQNLVDNTETLDLDADFSFNEDDSGPVCISDKDIKINGNNHVIDGKNSSGMFSIERSNVFIENLTFINGRAQNYDESGGALYTFFSNITLKNCKFINNFAFDGGAIYSESDNIEIINCSFISNVAVRGGAISSFNLNGFIDNSLFLNNSGSGAAILFDYTYEHDFIISNSIFKGNVAEEYLKLGGGPRYYAYLTSSDNLADHQIVLDVDQDEHLPYYNFSNLTFVNVTFNEFKNQSYKVKPDDRNSNLDNETIRFELFKDGEILINTTNVTKDGKATIEIGNLSDGDYSLYAYYKDLSDSIIHLLKEVDFTMSVEDIVVGEDLTVYFNISSDIEQHDDYHGDVRGYFEVLRYDDNEWVRDDYFYFKYNNFTIPALPSGRHIISLDYAGDKFYFPKRINQTFNVYPADHNMTGNKSLLNLNFEKTSDGNRRLLINLTDIDGNPLNGKTISIKVNGVTYERITDVNGHVSFPINLTIEGDIPFIVSFNGDDEYLPTTEPVILSIPESIYCDSYMSKYCGVSKAFYARFMDHDGDYLSGGKATFNINGVFYTRDIDELGYAMININLDQGNYTITAINPVTGAMKSCLIEVLPTITDNNDLVKYYRNDSQYIVRLQGPETIQQEVIFNINGVFYTRHSDEEGFTKLNINLGAGEYIITVEFNGCRVSNKITVLSVLNASDLKMYYRNGSKFIATLVDGKGNFLTNANVKFNINGVFYQRTTDEYGMAKLNINLEPGEYIITSDFNGCMISNIITVLPVLNATDLKMNYKDGSQFEVQLVDGKGNPLANTNIIFNINGVFYTRTTDESGIARLNINLMNGEYIITSSYNGCNIANTITIV